MPVSRHSAVESLGVSAGGRAAVTAAELRQLTPDPPAQAVAEAIAAVRAGGDAAVLELENQFNPAANATSIAPVAPELLTAALEGLEPALRSALESAIANVRAVSGNQVPSATFTELPQGHTVESRPVPVASAAVYVPGGRGSYPSTAIMCLVPALVAGVERIVLTTPARAAGAIDPTVAAVCELLDVSEVYALGGAQAIAALALGTETIAPVDVIVGPGNSYVQEAKRQLFGTIGLDGVAGPSELAVVADATADARHLALDLLAQAEHGPDSLVVLVSDQLPLLAAVERELGEVDAPVALVLAKELDDALALADQLAPEHMQICCEPETAERLAANVRQAGCLFVGYNGATAFGDYVAGSNHVLPTGSSARFASALSVATFIRRMSVVQIPDGAVGELADAGAAIADAEGFTDHRRSMSERAARLRES